MTWTVTCNVSLTDKSPVGNVTATWDKGEPGEFSYGGRVVLTPKDIAEFCARAKSELARAQTADASEAAYVVQILAEINK